MVLKVSAVVPGAINAEPIVIYADYINIVKFILKENNRYKTISGHL